MTCASQGVLISHESQGLSIELSHESTSLRIARLKLIKIEFNVRETLSLSNALFDRALMVINTQENACQ